MNDNYDIDLEQDIPDDDIPEDDTQTDSPALSSVPSDPNEKTEIVGIRFKKNGKTYYFDPNGFTLSQDDRVIVDTARGIEYGYTAVSNRMIKNSEICEPLRKVLRLATQEDTDIHNENVKKEIDGFNACIVLIDKHKLGMKLIDAELSFDRSKLVFYFSAEGRVDFRDLVKDLAAMFHHTRIEMRQIGIRDEAKILGGLGICGRPYCCNTFLSDFGQVSVKMAKEQNLSLNSAKISGSCGRLMCCLRYEYDTYLLEKSLTPKVDSRVMTPNGAGVVIAANPLAGIVKVKLDGTAEDAEAVVFVREDVMDESKYDGRTLTKTAVPDRKRRDDDIPSLAEFSTSAPAPQSVAAVPENTNEQKRDKSDKKHDRTNEPRQDRKRDKGYDRKNEQKNDAVSKTVAEATEEWENSDGNEKLGKDRPFHNKKHHKNNRRDNRGNKQGGEKNAPENRENPENSPQKHQTAENTSNKLQSDGANQGQHKKHKKPYYRHFNKNKNKGGGNGGAQQ